MFSVLQADTNNTEITMKNNNVYREWEVLAKYANSTRIEKAPLYNAEFEALIDPDTTTFIEVLTFANVPEAPLSMLDSFIVQLDTVTITGVKADKPSISHFENQMEYIPYDLLDASYGTAAVSYTAAAGGFPLGDLNWYPDKKADWEAWVAAGKPVAIDETEVLPAAFKLSQNYPNPFNPSTMIEFELKKDAYTKLSVYNMLGQRVRNLVDQKQTAGRHLVQWDGMDENGKAVSSGIYFYRIEIESFSAAKKMLLIR